MSCEMSEAKFTKGTWVADIRGGCCAVYEESRSGDTNGCHYDDDRNIYYSMRDAKYNGRHWGMSEEHVANAHLISCAPEMYEMLYIFVKSVEDDSSEDFLYQFNAIKSLLTKARGETQ